MKVLMTLVLVLLLAGCAAGQGSAGPTIAEEETTARHAEDETTAHSAQEETTVLEGRVHLRRPPESTLSYGGREVKGLLGTYEWPSVIADAPILVPRKQKTLTVPSGSEMVFRYGGQRPPKTVNPGAYTFYYTFDKRGQADYSSRRSLKVHGSEVERTIPAELPPGEYVLEVFVEVQQGDADYYFRIMVK